MVLLLEISTPCKVQAEWPRMDVIVLTLVLGPRSKLHIHSAPILHPFCMAIIVGLAMRTVVE